MKRSLRLDFFLLIFLTIVKNDRFLTTPIHIQKNETLTKYMTNPPF